TEAMACRDCRVMVVGGGNSAGQSAMHLSRYAREVHLVIRRADLSTTMSQYLIEQIAATSNIRVRPFSVVEAVEGSGRLERVSVRAVQTDESMVEEVDALFVFIGTRPHSDWLPESVLRDDKGFVLTGRDTEISDRFPPL